MKTVGVHEAKTHLSSLLETVEAGEEVIIARSGKPVAKLVPLKPRPRRPGRLKGKIKVHRDFDAPLPDEVARGFRSALVRSRLRLWSVAAAPEPSRASLCSRAPPGPCSSPGL